jgi:hypothetical protein
LLAVVLGLAACGDEKEAPAESVAIEKGAGDPTAVRTPSTPGTMFDLEYEILGTPIVGSPVAIDLAITSAYGEDPVDIGFQITDPSSLRMDEAQPTSLTRAPSAGERVIRERITVIPQREGRLYFNVSASRSDDRGTATTVISIPIHVGEVDTSLQEHGVLETDDEGETTRVLTAE